MSIDALKTLSGQHELSPRGGGVVPAGHRLLCACVLVLSGMVAGGLSLAGCQSPHTAGIDASAAAASDLAIEVIVRSGRQRPEVYAGAENRSGHYVVLPDGSLHAGPPGRGLPPRQRVLTKDELRQLRTLLADLEARYEVTLPAQTGGAVPEPGSLIVMVDIREPGYVRMVSRQAGPSEPLDSESAALIRLLAALAWTPDVEPIRQQRAPRRYDLGPDPHERYRPTSANADRP